MALQSQPQVNVATRETFTVQLPENRVVKPTALPTVDRGVLQGYLAYEWVLTRTKRFWSYFFLFLFSRTYHRSFVDNVLRNKNVPPTVFPAFLKSKKKSAPDRLPPPENGASEFSGRKRCPHFPRKMGFPSGGAFKISPAGILRV